MSWNSVKPLLALCACLLLAGRGQAADEHSVNELIATLKSADEPARVQAIDQLGSHGDKAAAAVAPLAELLKDKSAGVRAHAAHALGEIGAPAKPVVAELGELLKDPDPAVRRQAINAVLAIRPGPQVTVPICVKLLEDSDPGIRVRILNAISDAGPRAVPGLIEALKVDKAAYWACLVAQELGPVAKDTIPGLAARIKDPRPEVRREAILALGAMEQAAAPAVPQIAAALKDQHAASAATFALARIGPIPSSIEPAIRENAKNSDPLLSTISLWALAKSHPEDKPLRAEVTERLIGRLSDTDPYVRAAAARGLASLPPAPDVTVPIWEKALKTADETTVHYALDAIAQLGAAAVPRLVRALNDGTLRPQIAQVLRQIGPAAAPATDALAGLIDDPEEQVSRSAILALAGIGPGAKSAVAALVKSLQQAEAPNAHAIVYALGAIGPGAAAAEPALMKLMGGPNQDLALISAWAATKIQPESAEVTAKAVSVLIAGLASPSPLVRRGAAETLGHIGRPAKAADAALQAAAKDHDLSVRDAASQALVAIRG